MGEMEELRLTPALRRSLQWFSERGTVRLFGIGDPSLTMVRKLRKRGLVEIDPAPEAVRGPFKFTGFRISTRGRRALIKDQSNG